MAGGVVDFRRSGCYFAEIKVLTLPTTIKLTGPTPFMSTFLTDLNENSHSRISAAVTGPHPDSTFTSFRAIFSTM